MVESEERHNKYGVAGDDVEDAPYTKAEVVMVVALVKELGDEHPKDWKILLKLGQSVLKERSAQDVRFIWTQIWTQYKKQSSLFQERNSFEKNCEHLLSLLRNSIAEKMTQKEEVIYISSASNSEASGLTVASSSDSDCQILESERIETEAVTSREDTQKPSEQPAYCKNVTQMYERNDENVLVRRKREETCTTEVGSEPSKPSGDVNIEAKRVKVEKNRTQTESSDTSDVNIEAKSAKAERGQTQTERPGRSDTSDVNIEAKSAKAEKNRTQTGSSDTSDVNIEAKSAKADKSQPSTSKEDDIQGDLEYMKNILGKDHIRNSKDYQEADRIEWEMRNKVLQMQSSKAQLERKRRKEEAVRLKTRLTTVRSNLAAAQKESDQINYIRPIVNRDIQMKTMGSQHFPTVVYRLGIVARGPRATRELMTKIYRKALLKFHPDRTTRLDLREKVMYEEIFKLLQSTYKKYMGH